MLKRPTQVGNDLKTNLGFLAFVSPGVLKGPQRHVCRFGPAGIANIYRLDRIEENL